MPATTTPPAISTPPALLTAVDATAHVHLIVGAATHPLTTARCLKSLDVGARPVLIAQETDNSASEKISSSGLPAQQLPHALAQRVEDGSVTWLRRAFQSDDLTRLGREEVLRVVDAVFVTPGAGGQPAQEEGWDKAKDRAANVAIYEQCRRLRVPINVADTPALCTFTLLSTYAEGPLQIGVTTSGRGCKLAARIRREVAANLPKGLGEAVERLGTVRRKIWEEDHHQEILKNASSSGGGEQNEGDYELEDDESGQTASFNRLIIPSDAEAAKARRMRWLAQICEYWPLRRLAAINDEDVESILQAYKRDSAHAPTSTPSDPSPILSPTLLDTRRRPTGRIILAGAGPGHPDLLTTATLKALRSADLILADKLVPASVLALVPRRTPIHIARKFPGNADAAQDELHSLGLAALKKGQTVLRLKQGDPYLYGRGAEEVEFFSSHGFVPVVLPGITSALSAPLFAQIPVTHRGVAEQVVICTGTGRSGARPDPPSWRKGKTVVFLMGLHRITDLVGSLTTKSEDGMEGFVPWPTSTPCAVIERASCPDQRVIRTTLAHVVAAIEHEGSRPPGLLVVGSACEVICKPASAAAVSSTSRSVAAEKQKEVDASPRWTVEDGWSGLDGLDGFEPTPASDESEGDVRKEGKDGDAKRKEGLETLRDMLLTPGVEADARPDPLATLKMKKMEVEKVDIVRSVVTP